MGDLGRREGRVQEGGGEKTQKSRSRMEKGDSMMEHDNRVVASNNDQGMFAFTTLGVGRLL